MWSSRSRQSSRGRTKDINYREFAILGVLAAAVLIVGLWPAPLTELMQATVQHLVQQIATSKLPL